MKVLTLFNGMASMMQEVSHASTTYQYTNNIKLNNADIDSVKAEEYTAVLEDCILCDF